MSLRNLLPKKRTQYVEYKYNLNNWLLQLDKDKRQYAIEALSFHCGVSIRTFNSWRYIKVNQSAEIALSCAIKICRFLNKDINDFEHYSIMNDFENKLIKKN